MSYTPGPWEAKRGNVGDSYPFFVVVSFVTLELKASGEQWSDQAKQDLISTFIIAASKAGMLQVWERGESE